MGYIRKPVSAYPRTIPQLYLIWETRERIPASCMAKRGEVARRRVPIEGLNWENPNFRLYTCMLRILDLF